VLISGITRPYQIGWEPEQTRLVAVFGKDHVAMESKRLSPFVFEIPTLQVDGVGKSIVHHFSKQCLCCSKIGVPQVNLEPVK
jgi:hypothetical protein